MLPKKQRLTAGEVRAILKSGRSLKGQEASLKYVSASSAKAAVVVSKKVAQTAVSRNRLRRLGYRALTPPPKDRHLVLFILSKDISADSIRALCSRLS